ncbi:type III-B CRISPR module-associated protein Cmr5 [Thermococcus sp. Bubb.Bath]|uniref:type III-B CRISPR module-associated protein Cmr5 n=1 Tax=Thermococcus sp. Bubb.Bath TaxID=1638242 RepID=UPI00143C93E3|nr:type III-B CRISPR module-associated protein Cmr5 [Thermococcus sp. Bubb.Bath]NJF24409.1 type III-B CRISPR module-associated protein Cmr5 [Thermococcus sp. Bubb.Bath]
MDLRSIEQERAKFAYEKVSDVKREDTKTQGRYRSYVKSAPVMILTNGLGQTLAFYLSKLDKNEAVDHSSLDPKNEQEGDKRAYAYLYRHLGEWLAMKVTGGEDPLRFYMNASGTQAIVLTDEAIALLSWLKRFADAMLAEDKNGD